MMSSTEGSFGHSASLDDLAALTDELAALVRAGVPLEGGLARAARDLSRHPGKLAARLSERLRRGESLTEIVASSPDLFPPHYAAVIEAGLRAGRLPVALEGLATTFRRAADLRRLSSRALAYPLFVLLLTFILFVASLIYFQPWMMSTRDMMEVGPERINVGLVELGQTAAYWAPMVLLVVAGVIVFLWYRSRLAVGGDWLGSRLLPTQRLLCYGRAATFTETLALLVENGNPYDRSIVLAAEASGDRALRRGAHQLAEQLSRGGTGQLSRGETGRGSAPAAAGFPPLLGWLLSQGQQMPATFPTALRDMADAYRRRAQRLDQWLRLYLPIVLTAVIGGTAVLLYALSVFIPWYTTVREIGLP